MGALFLYLDSTKSSSPKRNENAMTINVLVPGPHTLIARAGWEKPLKQWAFSIYQKIPEIPVGL